MLINLTISLTLAYFISSSWESWTHRRILHANVRARQTWRKYGRIGKLLRLAYFYHNTIRHRRTYTISFFIQLESTEQKKRLVRLLNKRICDRLEASHYGLTISGFWEFFTFAAVPLLVNSTIFLVFSPTWLPLGVLIALLPLTLTRYLHPLLHADPKQLSTGSFASKVCATALFQYIQHYHQLHHQAGMVNFNLLLGADWLFRVHKTVSTK